MTSSTTWTPHSRCPPPFWSRHWPENHLDFLQAASIYLSDGAGSSYDASPESPNILVPIESQIGPISWSHTKLSVQWQCLMGRWVVCSNSEYRVSSSCFDLELTCSWNRPWAWPWAWPLSLTMGTALVPVSCVFDLAVTVVGCSLAMPAVPSVQLWSDKLEHFI